MVNNEKERKEHEIKILSCCWHFYQQLKSVKNLILSGN